jgi:hypothetical protein
MVFGMITPSCMLQMCRLAAQRTSLYTCVIDIQVLAQMD